MGRLATLSPLTLRIRSYGIGQQYNDHWDWFDAKTLEARLNRAA